MFLIIFMGLVMIVICCVVIRSVEQTSKQTEMKRDVIVKRDVLVVIMGMILVVILASYLHFGE